MKPLIKKLTGLLVGLALFSSVIGVQSATKTLDVTLGRAHTNLFTGAARITSIVITHASLTAATNFVYRFIDSPVTNLAIGHNAIGQVVGAYTTVVTRMQWYTNWSTNFTTGLTNFVAFYAPSNAFETVAAHTNTWKLIATGTTVTQTVTTITLPSDGYDVQWGLSMTNSGPLDGTVTISVTYFPWL